jgi:hypothetical protein
MLIYDVAIGLFVYFFAKFLNKIRFNDKPSKKFIAAAMAILLFIALFFLYFILRLYVHTQLEASTGMQLEQKKFFSISQSIMGAILFYIVINKNAKKTAAPAEIDKIEPKF